MIIMKLYSGNGVSLSPIEEEGRELSNYVRLIADEDKAITNGTIITTCADVLENEADAWADCEMPEEWLEENI